MKKSFVYILVALICCIACDDNTGTIGNTTTPGSDSINIKTQTYYATTRSIAVDSVLGKTSNVYLGRFTDPQTGSLLEADFIAQFNYNLRFFGKKGSKNLADYGISDGKAPQGMGPMGGPGGHR